MLTSPNDSDLDTNKRAVTPVSADRPMSDFAEGMSYLRRFTNQRGSEIERHVLPYKGRLYVLTNDLFIDYEVRNPPKLKVAFPNHDFSGPNPAIYAALESFDRHWRDFDKGVKPTQKLRKLPLRTPRGIRTDDIYLNSNAVVLREGGAGKEWNIFNFYEFASGASRTMRFSRAAFSKMVKIATEINFESSPVCFRYKHGRGMLVERTLGSDVPDFEVESA